MPPVYPGQILRSLFMDELGLTAEDLAARTGYPALYIEALTRQEKRGSESFAVALGEVFGTSAGVWLNLQRSTDAFAAKQATR